MIRVLVVEDSPTVRRHLCHALGADSEFVVVGEASDGDSAIGMCERLRPDAVSMDMQLAGRNGLEATEWIMGHCPTPILVVSASTNRGELLHTYEALAAGAVDVLEKPTGAEPPGEWEHRYRAALRMVSRIRVITHPRTRLPPRTRAIARTEPVEVGAVVIGASTGGPGAVLAVLRALPASFRVPIVVVIHIAEPFGGALAEWLDRECGRPVAWPRTGEALADFAGRAVVAPAGAHLVVRAGRLHTDRGPERHGCRPSVDVLFESAAELGGGAIGVLLTGMGRDGAAGLLAMRRAGARTIAQDEATCVVYGMPREAARIGAAEQILPLDRIAAAIVAAHRVSP